MASLIVPARIIGVPMRLSAADRVTVGVAMALGLVLLIGAASFMSIQQLLDTAGEVDRSYQAMAAQRQALLQFVSDSRQADGHAAQVQAVTPDAGRAVLDSMLAASSALEREEVQRLAGVNQRAAAQARTALLIMGGGGLLAFAIALASMVMIRRDHTERRRAERALRDSETLLSQFMENLPIGVMVVDTQLRPRFANNAAVDIVGTSVLVDLGEEPLPLFRTRDQSVYPEARRPLNRALRGESATIDDAAVQVEGRFAPIQVSAAPIYDASGRIAYAIAAFSDITERRRTEEALRGAKEAAEAANRTKSEFLARMSHELRTPLNSVIGFASILLKNRTGSFGESDIAYLDRILQNGKHLLLLINDILDLAKVEAGKVEVDTDTTDLGALLSSVAALFDEQLSQGAVRINLVVPDVIDPLVTDEARLRQVLVNLVGNAVKFTERGEITVAVETAPATTRATRIIVRDTGIGIPDNRLGAVFAMFEQAESSTARKYGGTGLGLPISRALCELLGYELTVHSQVGTGTEFTIHLTGQAASADQGTQDMADDTAGPGSEPIVLIVDDESDSRALLSHCIEEFGCRALTAESADAALRVARECRPDLITLDLMMPGTNGWELLAQLKADPQLADIPVVIASIVAQENRSTVLGSVDILQKPVERDDLFAVLQRNLRSERARVLLVDDDAAALQLLSGLLIEHVADLRTAVDGRDALRVLLDFEPDIVITDLLMPVMDGLAFLDVLRSTTRFRRMPVIVLTARDLTAEDRARLERHTASVLRKTSTLPADLRNALFTMLPRVRHDAGDHVAAG
jgi:PAS domain S-box-containing protein